MEEEKWVLQIKEYRNYNQELLLIRQKLIEKILGLKNVNYYHKKDIKKGMNIYIFFQMGEIIYLEKEKITDILTSINKLENDDIFFSDNYELEIYNRSNFSKTKDIEGVKVIKDKNKNIKIEKELKNKYLSQNPKMITTFLNLFPTVKGKFFEYNDVYDRENMERIDKYQVPLYKVFRENKFALLNILKNHKLNYCPDDINHFLLHDRIPFINYDELKESLGKYYDTKKEPYHKIFKKDKEDTCLYLMGRNEVIVVEDPEGHNIYSKSPLVDKEEELLMRQNYINKFDKIVENNKEIHLDIMSNKDILNIEINNNRAYVNPINPKDMDKKNNYHRGYYDNGIYECEEDIMSNKENDRHDIGEEKLKTVDSKLIGIEIMLDYDDFYNVIIEIETKIIELMYFHIPKDKEFILKANIEKLWEKGHFLSPFGKAVYSNDNVILEKELSKPEWLKSSDKHEFDRLIKYISTI